MLGSLITLRSRYFCVKLYVGLYEYGRSGVNSSVVMDKCDGF